MKPIKVTITKETLNHLCEGYLSGTLYSHDFVDLLGVVKLGGPAIGFFLDKFEEFYEKSMELKKADKWGYDVGEQGEKFADYLLELVEKLKK